MSVPSLEPPVRVMALHSLTYCEQLFYLEEVEEIRLADESVYAGRQLHCATRTRMYDPDANPSDAERRLAPADTTATAHRRVCEPL